MNNNIHNKISLPSFICLHLPPVKTLPLPQFR
jgi:hypothetical protein